MYQVQRPEGLVLDSTVWTSKGKKSKSLNQHHTLNSERHQLRFRERRCVWKRANWQVEVTRQPDEPAEQGRRTEPAGLLEKVFVNGAEMVKLMEEKQGRGSCFWFHLYLVWLFYSVRVHFISFHVTSHLTHFTRSLLYFCLISRELFIFEDKRLVFCPYCEYLHTKSTM